MKKLISLVLSASMIFALAACSSSESTETKTETKTETTETAKAPKFVLCISHMSNAFTVEVADSMQAAADAAGAELTINEAGQDINTQVGQIESAVTQGVDAIIVEPVSTEGVLAAITSAEDAGIPVIVFNQNVTEPERATSFVGVANADLGYMEMSRAIEDMGGAGNVAILLGPLGSDGQVGRSAGYEKALAENPDVKVVFEEPANWTTEEGLTLAENWLQTGTEINAFVAQNDNMALGAVKAIEDKGLEADIKCYGVDAVEDALKAIDAGRLAVTISQATASQSQAAIDTAMKLYNGEEVPAEVLVDGLAIDKDNVSEFLK